MIRDPLYQQREPKGGAFPGERALPGGIYFHKEKEG